MPMQGKFGQGFEPNQLLGSSQFWVFSNIVVSAEQRKRWRDDFHMNSCYCCEFMTQNDCCVVTPFRPLHVQMVFLTIMIDGCKVILGTNGEAFTTSAGYPVAGVVSTVNYQVI